LCNCLLDISNITPPKKGGTLSLASIYNLAMPEIKPMQSIIPTQIQLAATLPFGDHIEPNYNPFPETLVSINNIQDKIEIMSSLAQPKKITMTGSDGKDYLFLCKPKDDLRKDCRMMEFNTMINKLLKKHPETRRRKLRIRTYAVVPLNEECGLIEWVPNTTGLRPILNNLYAAEGIAMTGVQVEQRMERSQIHSYAHLPAATREMGRPEVEATGKIPTIFGRLPARLPQVVLEVLSGPHYLV